VIGVETCASHERPRHALLSRTPVDLCMGASQNSPNHAIETPKLSHPPCIMRVDFTKTGGRQGLGVMAYRYEPVQLHIMWSWRDGLPSDAADCGLSCTESCPRRGDSCSECGPQFPLIAGPTPLDCRLLQLWGVLRGNPCQDLLVSSSEVAHVPATRCHTS
jgi:hypothetical protein